MLKMIATAAFGSLASAAILLGPGSASAASLAPGQYDLNGEQQICILSDKTWYSTSYPDWSGEWGKKQKTLYLHGNWEDGFGNTVITIVNPTSSPYKAIWIDWSETSSFREIAPKSTFSFLKVICDPPASPNARNGKKSPQG